MNQSIRQPTRIASNCPAADAASSFGYPEGEIRGSARGHPRAGGTCSSYSARELLRRPPGRRRPSAQGGADPGSVNGLFGDVTAEEEQ